MVQIIILDVYEKKKNIISIAVILHNNNILLGINRDIYRWKLYTDIIWKAVQELITQVSYTEII